MSKDRMVEKQVKIIQDDYEDELKAFERKLSEYLLLDQANQ